ncbi:MAG TPA: SAM-dependent methyltransferase, partial [Acidimicrobiia bacterium]|nr:SAM-dependent methyltransferase [Acidimicrobiia bacterium]
AAFVVGAFTARLEAMLADTDRWRDGRWDAQHVIDGSALDELAALEPASFDDIVFSPPYANRFDYCESQKVELWFGGFVDSYADLAALRKRSLRSHLGAALDRPLVAPPPELEALIGLIDPASYAGRARIPALLRGYCSDLAVVLAGCRRVLVPGGRCVVVVGNSAYGGVIVPVDALVARLGLAAGFDRAEVVPVRHLTVAPQQRRALTGRERWMRESLVVLA